MTKIKFAGPFSLRMKSFLALNRIALCAYANHLAGRRMEPGGDVNLEIGIRFTRHQFTQALLAASIAKGRLILDSLQTETSDRYDIETTRISTPRGTWYMPRKPSSTATILYCHGGGYSFHAAMSVRFAAMLAHHIGAPVFVPDYRLTPEHPHPAQAEDALEAWRYLAEKTPPKKIVVIGDSAGGHMMLTLLQNLRIHGTEQPALGIGLCPWTDIGARGDSLHGNDACDLVQGWMALQFGQWLDPEGRFGRAALSPINHNHAGNAPLYLQAGGWEILHDMIRQFAEKQVEFGADILLDVWPAMPHDFQLMDSTQTAATAALCRISAAVSAAVDQGPPLAPIAQTVVKGGMFAA